MSDDGDHTCPLCAEEMDITDQQLKPCKCGYDVCISIILLSDQSDCMLLPLPLQQRQPLWAQAANCRLLIFSCLCTNSSDLRLVLAPYHRHGWEGGDRGPLPCMSHSLRQGQDCQNGYHMWEVRQKLSAAMLSFTLLMLLPLSINLCFTSTDYSIWDYPFIMRNMWI